jgi:hypothetical protein
VTSLGAATIALALGRLLRAGRRLGPSTTLAAGCGTLVAAVRWFSVPAGLIAALVAMAIGGGLARRPATRLLSLMPGACLLATVAGLPGPGWARWSVCAAAWLAGGTAPDIDRLSPQAGPLLFTLSAVAVYFTVPDTERAVVVLGGTSALVLVGPFLRNQRLGGAGAAVVSALLAWAACFGAVGRPTTILGAAAAFGLLLAGPLVVGLRSTAWRVGSVDAGMVGGLLVAQLVIDVLSARVIGRAVSPASAIVMTALMALGVVSLGAMLDRQPRAGR